MRVAAGLLVFALISNVEAQQWVKVQSMNGMRHSHATVTGPDGMIYVIGGDDFGQCFQTVEQYNPRTNTQWVPRAKMPGGPRCHPSAVVGADGFIYVIGGSFGSVALDRVERYDTATGTWTSLPPLNEARVRPAVAVGPDLRIYAIGGTDAAGQPVTSIEAWNGSQWELLGAKASNARLAMTGLDGGIYTFGVGAGAPWARFDGKSWVAQGTMLPESKQNFAGTAGPDGYIYLPGIGITSKFGSSRVNQHELSGGLFNVSYLLESRDEAGGATAAEGRLFLTGGQTFLQPSDPFASPFKVLDSVEAYGPLNAPVLPGISAWFRFDETGTTNTVDESATSNTAATAIGTPPRPVGRVRRSIRLNGVSQYVKVTGAGVDFADGDMTIEGWVRWYRPANLNQIVPLIDKRTRSGKKYQGYAVYFYNGRLDVQLANGTAYMNYGSTKLIPNLEWTHIAITLNRSAKLLSVYVNGVLDK